MFLAKNLNSNANLVYPNGVIPPALPTQSLPSAFPPLPISQQNPLDLSTRSSSRGSLPSSDSSVASDSPRKTTNVTDFMHSHGKRAKTAITSVIRL